MSPQLTDADIARHDATVGKILTDADIAARDSNPHGYLSQVGTGLWNTVKGLAQVGVETGGVVFDPLNAIEHLKKLKQMVVDPQVDQAIKAADEWKKGNRSESVGHALAAVLPGVGPAAANIGEKLGNQDYIGAAADATVLGATMVAPKVAGAIADAAPILEGAAKEGYAAAKAPAVLKVKVKGVPIELPTPVPATVAGAATGATTGAGIGALVGAPGPGAVIGGVVGGAAPFVRGAIRGGRRVWNGPMPESFTEPPIQASEIIGERTAPAAPAPVVETPGMILVRESGGTPWEKLSAQEQASMEMVARARQNAAAAPQAPPRRPPEQPPGPGDEGAAPPAAPPDEPPPPPGGGAAPVPPAGKPAAADLAAQLEASMRTEALTDYIVRNKIPAAMLDEFGPKEWQMVSDQAGVKPPTPENIQAIRGNLAQYEGAANQPPEAGKMPPAEAQADFEQRRTTRNARKPKPAAADVEAQLADSLAAVEKGERPVAQVADEGAAKPTASEVRVNSFAERLAAERDISLADLGTIAQNPEALRYMDNLGRSMGIQGSLAPGDVAQIVDRVKLLRGAEAAAAPSTLRELMQPEPPAAPRARRSKPIR